MAENMQNNYSECGTVPSCPDLAFPYVPYQKTDGKKYSAKEALNFGTLFPALDMPFKNIRNSGLSMECQIKEAVSALSFVSNELNLYLDTHPDDTDAFDMLKTVTAMYDDARAEYVRLYGPISFSDTAMCDKYNWLNSPWPWEKHERSGN